MEYTLNFTRKDPDLIDNPDPQDQSQTQGTGRVRSSPGAETAGGNAAHWRIRTE